MAQFILTNKRGQGWGLDLIAAVTIFLAGIIILYVYAINYTAGTDNTLDDLYYQGNLVSELILTNDYGILSDGKIDQTKLDAFNNSYESKRALYGVKNDFYFKMDGMELNGAEADYAGKLNSSKTRNLMKITRIVIYKNKPTKLELFIYSE